MTDFERELSALLSKYGHEDGSNTPDFILARHMMRALQAFNSTIRDRDAWMARDKAPDGKERPAG